MLEDVRIVLVRPQRGGNVGAVARALKNMGLNHLVLVQPRELDEDEARRLAHGAEDVLRAARRTASLQEALAECRWSVGTTRRVGRHRLPHFSPRAFARAVRAAPERRPLAVVFGPEKDGLTDADLALCHERLCIPSTEEHPSLNLAQAVLIVAYELHMEATAGAEDSAPAASTEATGAELDGMYAHLEQVLYEIGFVRPETAAHQMRAFRQLLARARLVSDDVTLLRGLWRQTLWAARREPR
jgi:tRNA (cytidine32/uridine32-2'-O)-methyltransferase